MTIETADTKHRYRVTFCDERFYSYDITAEDEDEAYELAEAMALNEVPGAEGPGSTYGQYVDTEELSVVVKPTDR